MIVGENPIVLFALPNDYELPWFGLVWLVCWRAHARASLTPIILMRPWSWSNTASYIQEQSMKKCASCVAWALSVTDHNYNNLFGVTELLCVLLWLVYVKLSFLRLRHTGQFQELYFSCFIWVDVSICRVGRWSAALDARPSRLVRVDSLPPSTWWRKVSPTCVYVVEMAASPGPTSSAVSGQACWGSS